MFHDESEKFSVNSVLRESDFLQSIILHNINVGVVIIDVATHVIEHVNGKGVELFGGTEAQIVGNVCHCFLCPAETGLCPVTDMGQEIDSSDRILLRADGSHLSIQKSVRRIQINGESKLLETFIDVSERKEIENKLKESEANFRIFFNAIDDFLFVLDEQGNIINVNDTVTCRLEYTENEIIGRNVLMMHPEEQQAEVSRIVGEMLAGTADFCPIPLITKSGQLIQVETRVYQGSWNNKPALFGVSKDITRIKETEALFSGSSGLRVLLSKDQSILGPDESIITR
ncbi:MAG: PAS domain-containing protein [Proteobacteria bacterium]|nr:PAS domain-containing protein [Pseudomonadota bacterium]